MVQFYTGELVFEQLVELKRFLTTDTGTVFTMIFIEAAYAVNYCHIFRQNSF